MAIFFCFLFFLLSSATACDRCVHQSNAAYFPSSAPSSSPACGSGSLAPGFDDGHIVSGFAPLYRGGFGCGACFLIRCKNQTLCSGAGTKVILTDFNNKIKFQTDLILSEKAFMAMARKGMEKDILKLGIADVEYKRVPCDYKTQNLSVRVEETSRKPQYLAIKFLFQGGQTDIVRVDVAQVGSSNWSSMSRYSGPVWDASKVPAGALQFRLSVTAGYDEKWVSAPKVVPADWKAGVVYDLGLQISDIAQEGDCRPCNDKDWK